MKKGTQSSSVFNRCIGLQLKSCVFLTHLEKLSFLVTLLSGSEVAVSSLSQLHLEEAEALPCIRNHNNAYENRHPYFTTLVFLDIAAHQGNNICYWINSVFHWNFSTLNISAYHAFIYLISSFLLLFPPTSTSSARLFAWSMLSFRQQPFGGHDCCLLLLLKFPVQYSLNYSWSSSGISIRIFICSNKRPVWDGSTLDALQKSTETQIIPWTTYDFKVSFGILIAMSTSCGNTWITEEDYCHLQEFLLRGTFSSTDS